MREILFRGKLKCDGEWVEGYYLKKEENKHYIVDKQEPFYSTPYFYEVIPETVGQYTGLTDKNGNKIFEGDIVNFIHKGKCKLSDNSPLGVEVGEPYSRNYKIEYINTFASYGLRFINGSIHFPCKQSTLTMYDCEIIGNIHDNPELLGGEP